MKPNLLIQVLSMLVLGCAVRLYVINCPSLHSDAIEQNIVSVTRQEDQVRSVPLSALTQFHRTRNNSKDVVERINVEIDHERGNTSSAVPFSGSQNSKVSVREMLKPAVAWAPPSAQFNGVTISIDPTSGDAVASPAVFTSKSTARRRILSSPARNDPKLVMGRTGNQIMGFMNLVTLAAACGALVFDDSLHKRNSGIPPSPYKFVDFDLAPSMPCPKISRDFEVNLFYQRIQGVSKEFWLSNGTYVDEVRDSPYVINTRWGGRAPSAASLAVMSLFFGASRPDEVFGERCHPDMSRDDTLVLHIRSGDATKPSRTGKAMLSNYGQPPLECFWDAMKRFPRVVILTEDLTNPVAKSLHMLSTGQSGWSDHIPEKIASEMRLFAIGGNVSVVVKTESWKSTLSHLICGRNVLAAKSTISLIVTSSLNVRNLFLVGDCSRYPNITNQRRQVWMWKPGSLYRPFVRWTNEADQRSEMLTHMSGSKFQLC